MLDRLMKFKIVQLTIQTLVPKSVLEFIEFKKAGYNFNEDWNVFLKKQLALNNESYALTQNGKLFWIDGQLSIFKSKKAANDKGQDLRCDHKTIRIVKIDLKYKILRK